MMKKAIPTITALGMLFAVGPGFVTPLHAQTEESSVKVMSYNIFRGGTMRGQPLSQTVKVIQEAKADVVGVQETRSPSGVNAEKLAQLLGWNYYEEHRLLAFGKWSCILTRFEIVDRRDGGIKIKLTSGQEAYVFHIPSAHTDGDAAILFREANVIAPGDLVFRGIFPYIDLDNGGNVAGFIAGMERLIGMSDDETKFISGHGPLGTRAELQQDLTMLKDAASSVKALIDKGMDAEQIVAANPLAKYHDEYNWRFITTERMTKTLIRSLTEK